MRAASVTPSLHTRSRTQAHLPLSISAAGEKMPKASVLAPCIQEKGAGYTGAVAPSWWRLLGCMCLPVAVQMVRGPAHTINGMLRSPLTLKMGTRLAPAKSTNANAIHSLPLPVTCWTTVSLEKSSAPKAATKPSMARRPLMSSGAPLNAITSAQVGVGGKR